jgi:hypothetical protein
METDTTLDLINSFEAQEENLTTLFGGESGRRARSIRETNERKYGPNYRVMLNEAAKVFAGAAQSRRGLLLFQEALGTGDFPNLFADVLDRMMYAGYKEVAPVYEAFVRVDKSLRDFRPVKRFIVYGADDQLPLVPPQTEFPEAPLTDNFFTYSVSKYGKKLSFSFEDNVNDDMGALTKIPERLGRGARRTEQRFATGLYVDANGPHIGLYNPANKNLVNIANGAAANNPLLSLASLTDAIGILLNQVDEQGEPIDVGQLRLVVSPGDQVLAMQLMTATQLRINNAQIVAAGETVLGANYLSDFIAGGAPIVDRYITAIAKNRAPGSRPWFLFADPNEGRPALEMGFLAAFKEPQLYVKDPNARRVGGGAVDPTEGDFDYDANAFKVRHIMGGGRIDFRGTVASRGDGAP